MNVAAKYIGGTWICSIILLSGCSTSKTYKPQKNIDKPAWVQIDGSESRRGFPIFGSGYYTHLNIWRLYPETCEKYYEGVITTKKNRNSKKLSLSTDKPVELYVTRIRTSTSYAAYQGAVHSSNEVARTMLIQPKSGRGYIVKPNDLESDFYDFTLTEILNSNSTELPYIEENTLEHCQQVNIIKRRK